MQRTDDSSRLARDWVWPAIVLITTIGAFLLYALRSSRELKAESMIQMLEMGAKSYQLDHGGYPPGDGNGSLSLVNALRAPGPKGLPYIELDPVFLDREGNFRNPADPERIIHYRSPGIRNPKAVDLWCDDFKGRSEGINNWRK